MNHKVILSIFLGILTLAIGWLLIRDFAKPDCVEAQTCLPIPELGAFESMFINDSPSQSGANIRDHFCPGDSIRVSCQYYVPSNNDGKMGPINMSPLSPNGCRADSREGNDAWGIRVYCIPRL